MSEPPRGYTAQLVDPDNTARCATVIIAGLNERKAKGAANRMARAVGMYVEQFYPTPTTDRSPPCPA